MPKFILYHSSANSNSNCNFEVKLKPLTPNTTTQNYIREYIRDLYKNSELTKKVGNMTLVCNAFIIPQSETIRSADASFMLKGGNIYTKAIGTCNAQTNGDAQIGHVAEFSIIGGSGMFEGATGTVYQKVISNTLRELKFVINN